MPNYLV
jgi:hypothetical protein